MPTLTFEGEGDLSFEQSGTGAVSRSVQDKERDVVNLKDFGVTGDGTTDDGPAMLLAIDYQQSSGCILQGISGGTAKITTWSSVPSLTSPFYFDGNGMTVTCATTVKTAFVTVKVKASIRNTTFANWYRIISNPTGTTGTLDGFWFYNNIVSTTLSGPDNFAYPILLQNAVVRNVFIHKNLFTTVKVAAILIGDGVYASQANRTNIYITNNTIDGVTISSGATQIFAICVYGIGPLIDGNNISNVELGDGTPNGSNGAYGIYIKAPFARVTNNFVSNVGVTGTNTGADVDQIIGINLKGFNRGLTSDPVGYAELCSGNVINGVGGAATGGGIGTGISCDHVGVEICNNWIEGAGRRGILGDEGGTPTTDCIKVHGNNIIVLSGGMAGIQVYTSTGNQSIVGNTVNGGNAPCIVVRTGAAAFANGLIANNQMIGSAHGIYASSGTTLTLAMTKLNVKNNFLISGSHGFFANSDGSGGYSDVNVEGNDFSAASTAAFGGALITSCRIRNNKGYVSEKGGISSAIATGGTIAHGLAVQPGSYSVTPVGSATVTSVTADGANLTVNYSGGGTAAFAWEAKIPAYWT